jgi:hypothetical protein
LQLSWNLEKSLAGLNIDFSFDRVIFNSDDVDFVKRYDNYFNISKYCNTENDLEEEMLVKIEDRVPFIDNFKVPQPRPKFEPTKSLENFLHLKGIKTTQVPTALNFKTPTLASPINPSQPIPIPKPIKPTTIIKIAPKKQNKTQHKYLISLLIFKNNELIKLIEQQNVLLYEREFAHPYIIIDSKTVIM